MLAVNFPEANFRTRIHQDREEIFDNIRKKWVRLTPEEWVRQNFLAYLVKTAGYPGSLIGIEKLVVVGELRKRFDLVVFNQQGRPFMLVECKAMDVDLSNETISQTLAYLSELDCEFVLITNGRFTYGWRLGSGSFEPLIQFPTFKLIV